MINKVFLGLAFLCVGLGFLGVFVPLLPTTPFLLLALFLFARSSPKYAAKLVNNKILGPYVESYVNGQGMSVRVKFRTLILMWLVMSASAYFFTNTLWVRLLLLFIAVGVTIHIVRFKSSSHFSQKGANDDGCGGTPEDGGHI